MKRNENSSTLSRRDAIKLSSSIVAAPAAWTGAISDTEAKSSIGLRNPTTEYPRPPFPEQHQEPPGLALKMVPRPDHGEKSYKGSGRLAGRRTLITGDSGIGRAAAIAFAPEGADVAFGYLPVEEPDAKEVVDFIREAGRKAVPLPGDIRDENFCAKLVADAVSGSGSLDIVVSNAAKQAYRKSLLKVPSRSLSKVSAKQLTGKGIRVNGVAPGPVWTPLQPSGGQSAQKLAHFGADVPMGRPGQPAELAPAYVLLASNETSFMSGEIIENTGGRPLP